MKNLPYEFPFDGSQRFVHQLGGFFKRFPADGMSDPANRAAMDTLFGSVREMAKSDEFSLFAYLACQQIAKLVKSGLGNPETFKLNVKLLERYRVFDLEVYQQAERVAKKAYSKHAAAGGDLTTWAPRLHANQHFETVRGDTPSWSNNLNWQIEAATPKYQLIDLLAAYLINPDLLGVMKLSLERAVMIHHFRKSNVLKNLQKEVPAFLVKSGLPKAGMTMDQAIEGMGSNVQWLRHRDIHVANALYDKGRNGKVFVDTIEDKSWALDRITENLLRYKPNPVYLEAYLSMIVDLTRHVEPNESKQPIMAVARLLTMPGMTDKLDMDTIVERLVSTNLSDEALGAVMRMHEIHSLKIDEKAWADALLAEGLQKELMQHLASTYPNKKIRLAKLNELQLLDGRVNSEGLMENVLAEDLGL